MLQSAAMLLCFISASTLVAEEITYSSAATPVRDAANLSLTQDAIPVLDATSRAVPSGQAQPIRKSALAVQTANKAERANFSRVSSEPTPLPPMKLRNALIRQMKSQQAKPAGSLTTAIESASAQRFRSPETSAAVRDETQPIRTKFVKEAVAQEITTPIDTQEAFAQEPNTREIVTETFVEFGEPSRDLSTETRNVGAIVNEPIETRETEALGDRDRISENAFFKEFEDTCREDATASAELYGSSEGVARDIRRPDTAWGDERSLKSPETQTSTTAAFAPAAFGTAAAEPSDARPATFTTGSATARQTAERRIPQNNRRARRAGAGWWWLAPLTLLSLGWLFWMKGIMSEEDRDANAAADTTHAATAAAAAAKSSIERDVLTPATTEQSGSCNAGANVSIEFDTRELTQIDGIDEAVSTLLMSHGIRTCQDLADVKPTRLRSIFNADERFQHLDPTPILEQSSFLARGEREGLERWQRVNRTDRKRTASRGEDSSDTSFRVTETDRDDLTKVRGIGAATQE